MADFSTHLIGAAGLCSFGATLVAKVLGLPADEAALLAATGIAGGVLPDIDLQSATPTRLLFTAIGVATAMFWLFANLQRFSALELWGMALGVFLVVRWPLAWLFGRFTVHRGALHSLAAAFMAGSVATAAAARIGDADASLAWLIGGFMTTGYLLHLTLDELYSVDFTGARIRRSFGSALKPLDLERLPGSVLVLAVALLAWLWAPPVGPGLTTASALLDAALDRTPGLLLPQ